MEGRKEGRRCSAAAWRLHSTAQHSQYHDNNGRTGDDVKEKEGREGGREE